MNIIIARNKTYIPSFNDNRNLTDAEQVSVTYRIPDIQLKSKLKPKPKLKFVYDREGNTTGGETEISSDRSAVIGGMLVSIENLAFTDEKGEHRIIRAADLLQAPLEYEPLVEELYTEFSKELDRTANEKN